MDADAIVIGAGAAGLATARALAQGSLKTIVVEARDRIGGRVFSHATARVAVPAELGAEFIHGPAHETQALLLDAGLAAIDMAGDAWVRDAGGLRREDSDRFTAAAQILEGARFLTEDESVERYLARFDGSDEGRAAARAARAFVEGFDAADPAVASVAAIAEEWFSGVDWSSARPLGGYAPLFERLQRDCTGLGVDVRLSTQVRRIAWTPGSVRAEVLRNDGRAHALEARAAIVTVPAGVLRHRGDPSELVFDPELPRAKLEGLRAIETGDVVRVVMSFTAPFWEHICDGRYRDAGFFRCYDGPFGAFWTQYPVRSEQVVAWVGGPGARRLARTLANERVALALDSFGRLLGEQDAVQSAFEGGATHDWSSDPFARGAYSYVAVGGTGAREELAAPVAGTLFFAGEATAGGGQGGTVNGALHTGIRAAREAGAALGAKP